MKKIPVPIIIEDEDNVPVYGSEFASGADIRASNKEEIIIEPSKSWLIPTGISLAIPVGYEIQVRPRSGLAFKHQITVPNAPGTIDSDYRGELKIILINYGKTSFTVFYGMRIAQIVLAAVVQAEFVCHEVLTETKRGEGGFGHTGTH